MSNEAKTQNEGSPATKAPKEIKGDKTEQVVTRDNTPRVERPGQDPTTPERPPA